MLGVFFVDMFHSKVIDDVAEGDGSCLMGEKSGSVSRLDVAILAEVEDKVVIGENSCLRETVLAFGDLEVDKSIDDEELETVVLYNGLGNIAQGNAHVFRSFHRGVEIEVLDVECHKLCGRCGDDAVEE
jgi:hypothetical protein